MQCKSNINQLLNNLINVKPLSANITKWSNTIKQFFGNLPMNCLNVLDHFVGLALKRLNVTSELNRNKKKN